jgi:hypothetical protein
MRTLILLLLLCISLPAFAVICKTVDDQGNVTYSDIPEAECPNKVRLPELSTFEPRSLPDTGQAQAVDQQAEDATPVAYSEMRFDQPEEEGTVRSNEGKVPVSVVLEPPLQEGHKLRLLLDGIIVQPSFDSQTVVLSGVERGAHALQAQVIDASGAVLRSAGPLNFTLQRASVASPGGPGIPQPMPAPAR